MTGYKGTEAGREVDRNSQLNDHKAREKESAMLLCRKKACLTPTAGSAC